MVLDRSLEWAR